MRLNLVKNRICGRVRCRKNFIFKLLLRLYDVGEGAVLLNGVDIRDADLSSGSRSGGESQENPILD